MPARCNVLKSDVKRSPDASQTQYFEIRHLTQDAMFRNQASEVIFCAHASNVQFKSSYVLVDSSFYLFTLSRHKKSTFFLSQPVTKSCPVILLKYPIYQNKTGFRCKNVLPTSPDYLSAVITWSSM